jgi:hypothetical protein
MRDRRSVAVANELDRDPRSLDRLDHIVELPETTCRYPIVLRLAPVPQRPDRRPELAHRFATDAPDRLERRSCLVGALLEHVHPGSGLHADRRDRVGHDVMELARDPQALLDHAVLRLAIELGLGEPCTLEHLCPVPVPAEQEGAKQVRGADQRGLRHDVDDGIVSEDELCQGADHKPGEQSHQGSCLATESRRREQCHPQADHRRTTRVADDVIRDGDHLDHGHDRNGEAPAPQEGGCSGDSERVREQVRGDRSRLAPRRDAGHGEDRGHNGDARVLHPRREVLTQPGIQLGDPHSNEVTGPASALASVPG